MPVNDPTDAERLARQRDADLIQQGRDRERVESRLTQLELRADKVNGSQTRMADLQDVMNTKLTKIIIGMEARSEDADRSGDRTYKRWQTVGVVFAIFVGLLGLIFIAIQTIHGLK